MARRRRIVFDGIWVRVSRETGIIHADWVHSRPSPSVKRNKQDETFVIFPTFRGRGRRYVVGDQLRRDVQHWLSAPDPSTNHGFVRKARHTGTAAWFFESNALTEWKAKGSLLWIHGKRKLFEPPTSALH